MAKIKIETVYHGSDKIVKIPEFGKGNPNNDYGIGFYTTKNKGLAGEWAVLYNKKDGYINEYTLDYADLKVLYLNQMPIENWVSILATYRKIEYGGNYDSRINRFLELYGLDLSSYDIIEGWRADDAFFTYINDFFAIALSVEKMKEAMSFGSLGNQICLKSERAFKQLKFVEPPYLAQMSKFYKLAEERDLKARREYYKMPGKAVGTLLIDLIGREYL